MEEKTTSEQKPEQNNTIFTASDNVVSAGSELLDFLLNGGFEKDTITTIYGESGSGKTNLCIIAAVNLTRAGKKIIFIDTEGGFSVERLKQLAPDDYSELINNIIFLKPTNFSEQRIAFSKLGSLVEKDISMIIVDTISMLYRLELGKTPDVYNVNRDLGAQLSYLSEIARRKNIPVLLTNQVYSNFEQKDSNNVNKMVGGDILKYTTKCLIEIQKGHKGLRKAILRKHRSIADDREVKFRIINSGIERVEN
jgi:DNA repair protein RadB